MTKLELDDIMNGILKPVVDSTMKNLVEVCNMAGVDKIMTVIGVEDGSEMAMYRLQIERLYKEEAEEVKKRAETEIDKEGLR